MYGSSVAADVTNCLDSAVLRVDGAVALEVSGNPVIQYDGPLLLPYIGRYQQVSWREVE
jgi:hypothetical protein